MGVRAPLTIVSCVLGVALVAWASGALALHIARQPTGCVPLRAGDRMVRVPAAGVERDVLVHVPRGTNGPRALVLVLHGAGQSGPRVARETGYSRLADREGFLVAYPSADGRRPFWNVGGGHDHVAALDRSLDALEGAACVDRARVFVTGVSDGATARLGCELSGRLAGVAAVAGDSKSPPPCRPQRPVPVLEIQGTAHRARSVDHWLAGWRRSDGCRGAPHGVTDVRWTACAERTVVEHVRLDGVRHGWPGGSGIAPPPAPFSSTWRTWAFFRALPSRRAA